MASLISTNRIDAVDGVDSIGAICIAGPLTASSLSAAANSAAGVAVSLSLSLSLSLLFDWIGVFLLDAAISGGFSFFLGFFFGFFFCFLLLLLLPPVPVPSLGQSHHTPPTLISGVPFLRERERERERRRRPLQIVPNWLKATVRVRPLSSGVPNSMDSFFLLRLCPKVSQSVPKCPKVSQSVPKATFRA